VTAWQSEAGPALIPLQNIRFGGLSRKRYTPRKNGMKMVNLQDAKNAANKRPSQRSAAEQRIVDNNMGNQAVRNADHAAKQEQKTYGSR
jgi:hypothetical protein